MLPTDASTRKGMPIFSGLVRYFPHAIAAVAQLSRVGNDQHNPGQPLHWAKEKSSDEMDALLRHATDAAIEETHRDPDGVLAAVKLAWRALANLERMHDRGLDIFHNEERSFPEREVDNTGDYADAAASDLTVDELRAYQRTLMDAEFERNRDEAETKRQRIRDNVRARLGPVLPATAAEYKAWTRNAEETTAYIAELNRGYGASIDDCSPSEWDRVSALRSGRAL